MNEATTSIAADEKPAVVQSNITPEQYLAQRSEALKGPPPQEESPPVGDGKEKDVHSQLDLGDLSEAEIAELAQKGKSGLLKRVAELTAKRKVAEERLANLEQMLSQQRPAQFTEAAVENNPYATITDAAVLQEKFSTTREVIEWAEEVLDRASDIGAQEIAVTVEGREMTKGEVRDELRKARKARDKYLPAQLKEVQNRQGYVAMRQALDVRARQELPWIEEEESDAKKNLAAMLADPRLKKLEEAVPELAPQMGYILAHAANSMFGRREIPLTDPKLAKPVTRSNPPASPSTTVAASPRSAEPSEKQERELTRRLEQTGSPSDFVALRTAQLSKRKLIRA